MKLTRIFLFILTLAVFVPFHTGSAQSATSGCYVTSPESGTVWRMGSIPINGDCASVYPGSSPQQGPTGGVGTVVPNNLPYIPLEPLPGQPTNGSPNFCNLLSLLFKVLIYFGGMVAVLFLVLGGITYMVSEVVDKRSAARERIKAALYGLLLLLVSWIILYTINPQLVNACNMVQPTQTGVYYAQTTDSLAQKMADCEANRSVVTSGTVKTTVISNFQSIPKGSSTPCKGQSSCSQSTSLGKVNYSVLREPTADQDGFICRTQTTIDSVMLLLP